MAARWRRPAGWRTWRPSIRSTTSLQYLAAIVLSFQFAIIGLCLTGPVFNTQLGVIFWTVTGALSGAMRGWSRSEPGETDD